MAFALLALFTATYAAHAIFAQPPDCNCMGRLSAFVASQESASGLILRNVALMACVGVPSVLDIRKRRRALHPRNAEQSLSTVHQTARSQRAFTLLETVLSIAIIALLVALTLPMLGQTRDLGRRMASASNLRQHVTVFTAYTSDFQEQFPYFTDPEATATVLRHGGIEIAIPYFGVHAFWNFAMADYGYDGQLMHPSMFTPRWERGHVMEIYHYACTFVASPEFYNRSTRTGPAQWRAVRASEVTYPSSKGLFKDNTDQILLDRRLTPSDPTIPLDISEGQEVTYPVGTGFVDGHVQFVRSDGFLQSYPRGDGLWPGSFPHNGPSPILHTMDGVRGRDIP